MTISMGDHEIKCEARKKLGWVRKSIPFEFKGTVFKIGINPVFLSQILERTTTMKTSEDVALFISESFRHIIALQTDEIGPAVTESQDDDIPF